MAATATSFGDGVFGITAEETGILIDSISHEYKNEKKSIKNRTGNTVGVTYYDETISISLDGRVPKTSSFSGTLAAVITLTNTPTNYLKGGVTGGLTIVEGVTIDMKSEEYQGIKITAVFYPNLTASV